EARRAARLQGPVLTALEVEPDDFIVETLVRAHQGAAAGADVHLQQAVAGGDHLADAARGRRSPNGLAVGVVDAAAVGMPGDGNRVAGAGDLPDLAGAGFNDQDALAADYGDGLAVGRPSGIRCVLDQ